MREIANWQLEIFNLQFLIQARSQILQSAAKLKITISIKKEPALDPTSSSLSFVYYA